MKLLSSFKKSIYSALVFFGTLLILSIGYAAYTLAPAIPGGALTADNWNAVLSAVNDIDSRIAATELSISMLQAAGGSLWTTVTGGIGYSLGKVGIGTSTPNKDLHIYNTTSNAEIDIQSVAGSNKHWGLYQNASDESLRFWNNSAGGDVLMITKGGNVGINFSSPNVKLYIVGSSIIDSANGSNRALWLAGGYGISNIQNLNGALLLTKNSPAMGSPTLNLGALDNSTSNWVYAIDTLSYGNSNGMTRKLALNPSGGNVGGGDNQSAY